MSDTNLKITLNLVGGLGNQLFIYFAGQTISQELNVKVDYHFEPILKPTYQSNSTIQSFDLILARNQSKKKKIWVRVRKLLPNELINFLHKIVTQLRFRDQVLSVKMIKTYRETNYSLRQEILEISRNLQKINKLFISGFFQNFDYFDVYRGPKDLVLKNPSPWFKQIEFQLRTSVPPIMVHLRLGDYLRTGNTIGLLSTEYWASAIEIAMNHSPQSEVWIISDEFELTKKILASVENERFKYIENSQDKDPAEVLLVLSMGLLVVLSNSTLSLWSGKLAKPGTKVLVPSPFFEDKPDQAKGIPDTWIKIPSKFFSTEQILNLLELRSIN